MYNTSKNFEISTGKFSYNLVATHLVKKFAAL